ncbi:MAG: TCR/Tet family MFS transporter [Bauldia sp.]|nr:TCR/Tet family MFS transporter [Bauldia sp.]
MIGLIRRLVEPSQQRTILVLLATLTVNMIGIGLLMPVLPDLVEDLAGDISSGSIAYGWIVAAYALMQFFFSPLLGALSDRFGRRPILLFSLAGLGIHYLLMAVAPTLAFITIVRIFGGMMGGSIGAGSAYIADITPPEKRAASFGLIGIAFGIGFIIGPGLGGLLGEIDVRLPFWAAALMCAGNLVIAWKFLPESLPKENRRPFRFRDANPVGAFILVSRYGAVVALMAVFAFTQLAERAMESTWVLFTKFRFDWGPVEVGISLLVVGLLIVFSEGYLVRVLVPRIGERRMLFGGLVVGGTCMLILTFASSVWLVYLAISFYVIGWGVVGPAARAIASRAVPRTEQGILNGAITSLQTATGVIAPPIAAGLFGFFVGPDAPFVFPGVPFLIGTLMFIAAIAVARAPRVQRAIAAGATAPAAE